MSSSLKKLVDELEQLLVVRGGLLDAPVRDEFERQIKSLKRAIDEEEDAARLRQLSADALNILAALLSVITNVMTLWN